MSTFTFLTHYNYTDQDSYYEYDDNPSLTDISGYISEEERLQGFIDAGQILSEYRSGYYDTDIESGGVNSPDQSVVDPNSDPLDGLTGDSFADYGTDLADISIAQRNLESAVRSRQLINQTRSVNNAEPQQTQTSASSGSVSSEKAGDPVVSSVSS